MAQPVIWFEVMGQNEETMKKFYGDMFEWSLDFDNPMKYAMLGCQEGSIPGGVGTSDKGSGWSTFYVKVDDIAASLQKATALGGAVIMPTYKTPDGGQIAVFSDPEGHPVGLVQTA